MTRLQEWQAGRPREYGGERVESTVLGGAQFLSCALEMYGCFLARRASEGFYQYPSLARRANKQLATLIHIRIGAEVLEQFLALFVVVHQVEALLVVLGFDAALGLFEQAAEHAPRAVRSAFTELIE